jgi:hypothetical protein
LRQAFNKARGLLMNSGPMQEVAPGLLFAAEGRARQAPEKSRVRTILGLRRRLGAGGLFTSLPVAGDRRDQRLIEQIEALELEHIARCHVRIQRFARLTPRPDQG